MPCFVILRHDLSGPGPRSGTHWDFMLEQGDMLRTWALAEAPAPARPIAAEALPAHRLDYLNYEGPISDNRGTVSRWDAGEYESIADSPGEVIVRLRSQRMNGIACLRQLPDNDHRWMFGFSE